MPVNTKEKQSALHFAPDAQLAPSPQFVTVLPDGREVSMDDAEGCREAALRIEMLSRGLIRQVSYDTQEAA